eukprot:CAMPEP_0194267400 /NCGR_PEP_ID=MMETSP0169-20130528/1913_1 /TAXON_ID=218684 /ORGANISM="Corethron pennatum, Strain L29A3" /LENGTH=360 /DNA_ID=CAMNT_0039008225 /DNA_START=55 /DNA_END=1134 /DNA_ORIENTATION=+
MGEIKNDGSRTTQPSRPRSRRSGTGPILVVVGGVTVFSLLMAARTGFFLAPPLHPPPPPVTDYGTTTTGGAASAPACLDRSRYTLPEDDGWKNIVTEWWTGPAPGLPGDEKTTVVLIGYSPARTPNFEKILPAYGAMVGTVDRVLLLWNNQEECPPPVPASTPVPIYVLPQRTNSLNNRMGPDVARYSRTRSLLHVDDDLLLSQPFIRKMVHAWATHNSNGLVGCASEPRYASSHLGIYGRVPPIGVNNPKLGKMVQNVVLTRSAMVGRTWIAPYWNHTAMRAHVDAEMNCEDIMLSALVRSGNGGHDPVYVEVTEKEWREELGTGRSAGLSHSTDGGEWLKRRKECVMKAPEFFGKDVW